nr:hypothetical protein B11C_110659 [Bartonella sp. 1-1C]
MIVFLYLIIIIIILIKIQITLKELTAILWSKGYLVYFKK